MLEVALEASEEGDSIVYGYLLSRPLTLLQLCAEYMAGFFHEQRKLAGRRSRVQLADAQDAAQARVAQLERQHTELSNQIRTLTTELKHKDEGTACSPPHARSP